MGEYISTLDLEFQIYTWIGLNLWPKPCRKLGGTGTCGPYKIVDQSLPFFAGRYYVVSDPKISNCTWFGLNVDRCVSFPVPNIQGVKQMPEQNFKTAVCFPQFISVFENWYWQCKMHRPKFINVNLFLFYVIFDLLSMLSAFKVMCVRVFYTSSFKHLVHSLIAFKFKL